MRKIISVLATMGALMFAGAMVMIMGGRQSLPGALISDQGGSILVPSAPTAVDVAASVTATRTVTLPLVVAGVTENLYGIGTYSAANPTTVNVLTSTNSAWTRRIGLVKWNLIEPTEGARNWSAMAASEQEMIAAAANGVKMIAVVGYTPNWAAIVQNKQCGPIRADKYEAFGNFLKDLVARYSVAPYNVKHWEIYNEPDVDIGPVASDLEWGCWGDNNDANYGGGRYGNMLKAIYPKIKQADSSSVVLNGGLLLDCDPNSPPPGKDCKASKFLKGMLDVGAGNSFDALSFHAYDYFEVRSGVPIYVNPNFGAASNTTGPSTIAKVNYLKNVMTSAGVSKPMMNTESAILVYQAPDEITPFPGNATRNQQFESIKSSFIAQQFAVAKALGLAANVWFADFGWFGSGLVTGDGAARPGKQAFVTSSQILGAATHVGSIASSDVGGAANVMGFKFKKGNKDVWVIWGKVDTSVTLPFMPTAIRDEVGNAVTATTNVSLPSQKVYYIEK